jgi:hypothetical protein
MLLTHAPRVRAVNTIATEPSLRTVLVIAQIVTPGLGDP